MFGAPHFTSHTPRGSTPTGEAWAANLLRKEFKEDASAFSKYASSLPEFPVRIERNPDFQTASPNKLGPGGLRGGEHACERPGVAWHSGTTEHFPAPNAVHQVQRAQEANRECRTGSQNVGADPPVLSSRIITAPSSISILLWLETISGPARQRRSAV